MNKRLEKVYMEWVFPIVLVLTLVLIAYGVAK